MGNQVKPVRYLLASIGHGWLHRIGHVLSPNAPCRTLGDARIRNPEFILKVALEWGNSGTRYLSPWNISWLVWFYTGRESLFPCSLNRTKILFSAIGCGDLPQPKHGYFKRKGSKAEIGCNASGEKWTLQCEGNMWKGKYKNCTSKEMIGTGGGPDPKGIFPSGNIV